MQIITNNPLIKKSNQKCPVEYLEADLLAVLKEAKNKIINDKEVMHTHPLSSSLKPNETVYKTIILSTNPNPCIDLDSLELIEQAIETHEKFQQNFSTPNWPKKVLDDFALIDYDLIMSTMPRLLYAR